MSDPFTAATGIAVRHDLTEDNEIQPKVWAAVEQGRVPPIHINWDTTTNATKSALRGVTEDLSDLPNLAGVLPFAKPEGLTAVPLVNTYAYVYVLAYRDEAFPDGPPTSWNVLLDPKFKGRVAIYNDGIGMHFPAVSRRRRQAGGYPRQHAAGLGLVHQAEGAGAAARRGSRTSPTWFQNGEIDVACTISSNAREAKKNGIKVELDGAGGGREDGHRLPVDPEGPAGGRPLLGQAVHQLRDRPRKRSRSGSTPLGLPGVRPGPDAAGRPRRRPVLSDHARSRLRQDDPRAAGGAGGARVAIGSPRSRRSCRAESQFAKCPGSSGSSHVACDGRGTMRSMVEGAASKRAVRHSPPPPPSAVPLPRFAGEEHDAVPEPRLAVRHTGQPIRSPGASSIVEAVAATLWPARLSARYPICCCCPRSS